MQAQSKVVKPIDEQSGNIEYFGSITQVTVVINTAGLLSVLLYCYLGMVGESSDGMNLSVFLITMTSLATICFLVVGYLSALNRSSAILENCNEKTLFWSVLMWAIVFRMVGVYFSPIYEDDFYRYLWDGYHHFQYGSPYGVAPDHYFGDLSLPDYLQTILDGINNPEIPTIYGPVFQYTFLAAYWIFPGDVFGLQLLYSFFDIALIVLLSKLVRPTILILYAWCPLVVKEIAFTAHPDSVGVFFLIVSFFALHKSYKNAAVVFLAISVCAKIFALLFVPFVLLRCQIRHSVLFCTVVVALYLPFVSGGGSDFAGLSAFANDWQFNGSLYPLLLYFTPESISSGVVKWFCLSIFLFFYLSYLWFFYKDKKIIWPRGDWIMGVFFLVAPVVNAWYLIWLLAFAVLYPGRWAWAASVAVLLSYITGVSVNDNSLELYQQPLWVRGLEYSIILIVLFIDRSKRKAPTKEIVMGMYAKE